MIIVLQDADFSANSIEKISIDRDLSSDAVALLANYTKILTKTKQLAVDDFITNCKLNGLWDKIKLIQFPILAGTLNECFYDFKSNSLALPTTLTNYSLGDKGLYLNATGNPSNIIKALTGVTNSNMHACSYLSQNISSGYPFFITSGGSTPYWWVNDRGLQLGDSTNKILANCDSNSVLIKGAKIATCRGITANDVDVVYSGIPTVSRSLVGTGIGSGGTSISTFQPIGYASSVIINIPYSYFSMGTSMTLSEMQIYNTLLENLMSILL